MDTRSSPRFKLSFKLLCQDSFFSGISRPVEQLAHVFPTSLAPTFFRHLPYHRSRGNAVKTTSSTKRSSTLASVCSSITQRSFGDHDNVILPSRHPDPKWRMTQTIWTAVADGGPFLPSQYQACHLHRHRHTGDHEVYPKSNLSWSKKGYAMAASRAVSMALSIFSLSLPSFLKNFHSYSRGPKNHISGATRTVLQYHTAEVLKFCVPLEPG